MLGVVDHALALEPATRCEHRAAHDPRRPDVAEDSPFVAQAIHEARLAEQPVELGAVLIGHLRADAGDVRVDGVGVTLCAGDGRPDRAQERVGQLERVAPGNVEAIDPILIQSVTRRLEREMLHTFPLQFRRKPMNLDRIGRCVLERRFACRTDETDRAQTGGLASFKSPDLAQRHRDRCFAIGSRHCGNRRGLRTKKMRRQMRKPQAWIFISEKGYAKFADPRRNFGPAQYGSSPATDSIAKKLSTIRLRAGQRGKKVAGLYLAAVARNAGKSCRCLHSVIGHRTRVQHLF